MSHPFKPGLFTRIELLLFNMLSDGMPHSKKELLGTFTDEFADANNLQVHMSRLRKKVAPYGRLIICEIYNRTVHYRQVRHLNCNDDRRHSLDSGNNLQIDELEHSS